MTVAGSNAAASASAHAPVLTQPAGVAFFIPGCAEGRGEERKWNGGCGSREQSAGRQEMLATKSPPSQQKKLKSGHNCVIVVTCSTRE